MLTYGDRHGDRRSGLEVEPPLGIQRAEDLEDGLRYTSKQLSDHHERIRAILTQ